MKENIREKYRCPECGSEDTIKAGSMLTKRWGRRPRRKCNKCATTFYADVDNNNIKRGVK